MDCKCNNNNLNNKINFKVALECKCSSNSSNNLNNLNNNNNNKMHYLCAVNHSLAQKLEITKNSSVMRASKSSLSARVHQTLSI